MSGARRFRGNVLSTPACCATALLLLAADPASAQWNLHWRIWQDSALTRLEQTGGKSIQRNEYALSYDWQTGDTRQRLAYLHEPILLRDGNPAHNGYFHRLDYSIAGSLDRIELQLNAGLHASSNMLKHADFHADGLVFSGQGRYLWAACGCEVGLNGDYRFGHFQLYPTLGWQRQITGDTRFSINLPYELALENEAKSWRVGIERYGNKWGALDSERQVESAYYLEEWRAVGAYRIAENLYGSDVFLELGLSFDTTVRYLDLGSGARKEAMEDAAFFGVVIKR